MLSNYKVITHKKRNYLVITNYKKYTKVITKLLLYYNVITFSFSALALSFNSELVDGKLIYGKADKNEQIFVENNYLNIGKNDKNLFNIPLTPNGDFVIGIPQDAKELKVIVKDLSKTKILTYPVTYRKWNEEYVNGLPPSKVETNKSDSERISKESLEMRLTRQKSTYPNFITTFKNPLPDQTRISSHFGSRRILNNIKKQGHSGTDYAAPIGSLVLAPAPGKVVYINQDMFLTGKTIMIDHGYGIFSSYSHLNEINVKLNQEVTTSDIIGKVGQTGRATGPHLHFTITWYGIRVNPEDLI